METGFKERSFKLIYWIMLIFLAGDTIDTIYRTVTGFLEMARTFPGRRHSR